MDDRILFQAEEKIIYDARRAVDTGQIAEGASREAFESLLEKYSKLYRQTRRLIRFSDRMQNDLNRVNRELHHSETKYRNIFENAAEGIFRISDAGHLLEVNAAMANIFGFSSPEELISRETRRRTLEEQNGYRELLALVGKTGDHIRHRTEMQRKDGEKIWVEIGAQAFHNAAGRITHIDGLLSDITEEKRLHEELTRQAHTDALTGILNRRRFLENLRGEIAQARRMKFPLSLAMIDIDYFKSINDAFGHDAGDRLLQRIARVCHNTLRERDSFGRLGGEEFAVCFPGVNHREAKKIADRLRRIIGAAQISVNDRMVSVTASIGLCELEEGVDSENFLKAADAALYRAKREGRNRVCLFSVGGSNDESPVSRLDETIVPDALFRGGIADRPLTVE